MEMLPEDRQLVFLGDYVDRGPDSRGVIEYLCQLRHERDCVFLRGNHDQMMLDSYNGDPEWIGTWLGNGAMSTLQSYGFTGYSKKAMRAEIPGYHIGFLTNTRHYYETDDFFFVHGGVRPDLSIAQAKIAQTDNGFLWERRHLDPSANPIWEKTVVCGHTIQDEPRIDANLIAIDTGAFLPYIHRGIGHLTAIMLPEREIVQVESIQVTAAELPRVEA